MGNSKWAPGGDNDKDDDNGNNRNSSRNEKNNDNRRNNRRAPPGPKHTGNRRSNTPQHQDNAQDWKNGNAPAPPYGTGSRRAPEQHGRHLDDGGRAPPRMGHVGNNVGYGGYDRSAAYPPPRAGYSPSNYPQHGQNLAVQPGRANAPVPAYGNNSHRVSEQAQQFNEGGEYAGNDVDHGFGRRSALSPAGFEHYQQRAIGAFRPGGANAAVPAHGNDSYRVSEQPRHTFDEGRSAPPEFNHTDNDELRYGKSAASPTAAHALSPTHPNRAVQPADTTAPVPKLKIKKSAVRIVGSAATSSPSASAASPVKTTAQVEDAVEETFTPSVPHINITPASATNPTAPSAQIPPAATRDIAAPTPAPMSTPTPENNAPPPPAITNNTPIATQEPTPSTTTPDPAHPFANTTFCIPPQGPLSDADFIFLMFKLRGRQMSAREWAGIAQQVLDATFGLPIVTAAEDEAVPEAHVDTSREPHTPLPPPETRLTEEQVDGEEEPVEQVCRARGSLDDEFARLMRK